MRLALRVWALALTLSSITDALPQITRTGKYLYDPSGNRFSIKGVAYQPEGALAASSTANAANGGFPEPSSFIDPLSSPQNCTRDLPYLKQLGVNAIRVYSVNSSLNHDECMSMLDSAGIYVLLDVSLPLNGSIDRASPAWTTNLLDGYMSTINAFLRYNNILAFNVGNEVINEESNTNSAPFVKAAARDIKAYLKSANSSALVGYAAVDGDPNFRNTLAQYLTCGDQSLQVDLYGLNNYEWCGNENINSSNWNTITQGFSALPVATYMSEYGCITSPPRLWTEVQALFAPPVSNVFSGGMAFSYFPTSDGFGMVNFSTDGTAVTVSGDFTRLSQQYNSTALPTTPAKSNVSATTVNCPAQNATLLASQTLPPTPDESVCNCVNQNALACRVTANSANQPAIVGVLTDEACGLLASSNSTASCSAIAGDGSAGTYGMLSMCSPAIKLSYAMSAYYESNPVDTSCDFAGNATFNPNRESSHDRVRSCADSFPEPNTAQDASTAADTCLAQEVSGGIFTPTATTSVITTTSSSTASASSGAASTGSSGSSNTKSSSAGQTVHIGGARWVSGVMGLLTVGLVSGRTI